MNESREASFPLLSLDSALTDGAVLGLDAATFHVGFHRVTAALVVNAAHFDVGPVTGGCAAFERDAGSVWLDGAMD